MIPIAVKKRRRRRKILIIGALLFIFLLAAPFLFPTFLVRYILHHSQLRELHLHFRSASLSPFGHFELRDILVDDEIDEQRKPLISAKTVRFDFDWTSLLSDHFKRILVEGASVTLRPGVATPVTLTRLMAVGGPSSAAATAPTATTIASSPASSPSSPPASAASESNAFWYDMLRIDGSVTIEGPYAWQAGLPISPRVPIPLQIISHTVGDPVHPTRDVVVLAGDPESSAASTAPASPNPNPALAARLSIYGGPAGQTVLTVDSLSLINCPAAAPRDWLVSLNLPPQLLNNYAARVDRIELSGTLTHPADGPTAISFSGSVQNLSAHAVDAPANAPVSLDHFDFSTHVEGRLTGLAKDLSFTNTRVACTAAQIERWRMHDLAADLKFEHPLITVSDFQADFDDGRINATGSVDVATADLTETRVRLQNVDIAALLRRLPPEIRPLVPGTIDGTLAGQFVLLKGDPGHYAVDVEVDCPNRLRLVAQSGSGAGAGQAGDAAVFNLMAGAIITCPRDFSGPPQVSNGRLTMDLCVAHPDGDAKRLITAEKVAADFSYADGTLRIGHVDTTLAGGTAVSGSAQFNFPTQSLVESTVKWSHLNAAEINPWLPGDMALAGQFDGSLSAAISPTQCVYQAELQSPNGSQITLPDRSTITLSSMENLQIAAKINPTDPAPHAIGSILLTNLSAATSAAPVTVNHVDLTADFDLPLQTKAIADAAITNAKLTAGQIHCYGETLTNATAAWALSHQELTVSDLAAGILDSPGSLKASLQYALATDTLQTASLHASNLDESLANPWLPWGARLAGSFNADLQIVRSLNTLDMNFSLQTLGPSKMTLADGTLTADAGIQAKTQFSLDPVKKIIAVQNASVSGLNSLHSDAAFIAAFEREPNPAALDIFQNGAIASLATATFSGTLDLQSSLCDGKITLDQLSLATASDAKTPVSIDNFSLSTAFHLDGQSIAKSTVTDAQLSAAKILYGLNTITALAVQGAAAQGHADAAQIAFTFAGGNFDGEAHAIYPITADSATQAKLSKVHLNFVHLDQATLSKNIAPDRFTAEGLIKGTIDLAQNKTGDLYGSVIFDTEGTGRLKISQDTAVGEFAGPIGQALAAEPSGIMPDNLNEIIIAQFANFGYTSGHAVLKDGDRGSGLELNYERPPLGPGDAGYGLTTKVGGLPVKATFEFGLKGTTLEFPGTNVAYLISRCMGLLNTPPPSAAKGAAPATSR